MWITIWIVLTRFILLLALCRHVYHYKNKGDDLSYNEAESFHEELITYAFLFIFIEVLIFFTAAYKLSCFLYRKISAGLLYIVYNIGKLTQKTIDIVDDNFETDSGE
jgi:membrane protease YdiL (CAAX protease family)